MKLRLLIALFVCFFSMQVQAQWSVNAGNTISGYLRMNSVYFLDGNTGFIGGSNNLLDGDGKISKTINGGANWKTVLNTSGAAINEIYFVNTTLGFAVGNDGLVAKTTDGGENWTTQRLTGGFSVKEPIRAVHFANTTTGFAVGGDATKYLIKTTDGGTTWAEVGQFFSQELNDVYVLNQNTAIAVGGNQFSGRSKIYMTSDGGTTWDTIPNPVSTYYEAVHFVDLNIGFIAGGNGTILKTINGGLSWSVTSNQDPSKAAITSMDFIDKTYGFATTQTGKILKTVNGGDTWTIDATLSGSISSFYDISVVSQSKGVAVGLSGTYAVKANTTGIEELLGKSFTIAPNPAKDQLQINFEHTVTDAEMTIFNMAGKVVFQKSDLNQVNLIALPEMAEGMYIIAIRHSEGQFNQKLMISK